MKLNLQRTITEQYILTYLTYLTYINKHSGINIFIFVLRICMCVFTLFEGHLGIKIPLKYWMEIKPIVRF